MKRPSDDFDRIFFIALVLLLAIGIAVVYSACQGGEDLGPGSDLWQKQIVFALIGLIAFGICAAVPHELWERIAPGLYIVAIVTLVAVLLIGSSAGGARRWIALGGFRFQPSEFGKFATILFLARVLALRRRPTESIWGMMVPALICLVPAGLVLKEPDLGTALVYLAFCLPMLYWSGVSFPYLLLCSSPLISVLCATNLFSWIGFTIFLLALAYFTKAMLLDKIVYGSLSIFAGIVTPLLWHHLEPYQQQRFIAFLDPTRYSSGAGYQIIQSKVAVGSGGLVGVGYLDGTQKGLAFLPARHTDFIFSVVGEEFGFLGTIIVVALFTTLLVRGYWIAAGSRDPFPGLVVVGILSMLTFQVFLNIGMALGLVPVTGVPLPILSYGGTSLMSTLAALGLVMGAALRRRI
ncbi:MAG TPA: rod shape-determining protein RodA [bacterium]|nr:rod shape-determining protein RodA [bacterium]